MEERHQFGRELHDGLGQQLTALEMMTHALACELKTAAPKQAKTAWEIARCIRRAVTQTRELAHGLSPVAAEGEGLMQALQELARMTTAAGTACEFACERPVKINDTTVAGHLYRIAQEAVTNAIQHAAPKQIRISLEAAEGHATLRVSDDGIGIDPAAAGRGAGLRIMRYRADLINAVLSIAPGTGGGTVVSCTFVIDPHGGHQDHDHE
jgi:signal transduction histidine kinase